MNTIRHSSTKDGTIVTAFPEILRADASAVADRMQCPTMALPGWSVTVRGEALNLPYRIHHEESEALFTHLSGVQAVIYACVLTRHTNGHVRQRQIERLASESLDWIAPFIIQLCSEYVIEILVDVEQRLPRIDRDTYGAFIRENPVFYRKTRDRMVSYWDCYYRWLYKRKRDYVGFRLFDQFDEWAR
ncbi:hypothetical protein WL76_31635 [Burkholderia ubonensis]|uniref:hypothetical protein n=1 Tax=Burkholderia ubonensis TaxID=101571 RepID=UPI00075DB625|nr:hypothetical protein [Burkholderia ubonensis]KWE44252.1 hypothetical protein WL76_31635 [Burkholderia ubonensis]